MSAYGTTMSRSSLSFLVDTALHRFVFLICDTRSHLGFSVVA
jgi:hypothetical protein